MRPEIKKERVITRSSSILPITLIFYELKVGTNSQLNRFYWVFSTVRVISGMIDYFLGIKKG